MFCLANGPLAAPPPEPKRFTDEELKQRYGIHLATRLQSDDPGKQANWADIDDDDEDWAPESIEWTDGTKITLPQADEAPPPLPTPEPAPAIIAKEIKPIEIAKPRSPAPTQASASPTVKPSGFGGRAGLVLKGATEKPTLVAKPPGPPTPVKSPWAPLPPVEKVPPIAIDVPQQQPQQNRFTQRDPHGFQGMPPPPAKEIAADDFSRSWRESSNTSKELYNSQSGRYEPVNDTRRGSVRNDARAHQPALLQRPSNQDGPAEPSAAFQTHRAGGQESGYGRRRTSSNVSGGSGNFVRRMSRGHDMPPHEMLNLRRGSLAAVSDEPSSPRNYSPSGQQGSQRGYSNQQWQSRASPVVSHPSPQPSQSQAVQPISASPEGPGVPAAVFEDPLETQKKIMRQTRELAIKRRQEEEAREEAAKKERIRLKLEAMGPPPESKKKEASKEEKPVPTQIQTREPAASAETNESNVTGDLKSDLLTTVEDGPSSNVVVEAKLIDKSSPEMRPNGVHPSQGSSAAQNLQEGKTQSWQHNAAPGSDQFKPWAPAPSQQSSSRNVWGPPTNDRTLGNGTFNPELSRVPDMHPSSHPGPIGPPNSSRGNNQYQQGRGREYGSRPAPIGPPSRYQPMSEQDRASRAAVAATGWGSLPQKLAHEEGIAARQRDTELAQTRELREKGLLPEPVLPDIQDTWRQVTIKEDGTRKVQGSVTTVHEGSAPEGPIEDQESGRRRDVENFTTQAPFNDAWRNSNMSLPSQTRGSRFFPNNRDVRLDEQNHIFDRPGSPSPPPPTMDGHPAYDGDTAHPHVSLPRPAPVVKLPPPTVLAPIGPPKPVSFAAAVQAATPPIATPKVATQGSSSSSRTSMYQDIRRQEPTVGGWQDRINSLIGRKNSPPKSHVLAVDSSSKNALDVLGQHRDATVSLPALTLEDLDDKPYESKPAAEECFEEQEMGSLPIVRIPHKVTPNGWVLASQPKPLPRKFLVSQITSVESIHFPQQFANNAITITIKVPGQPEAKNISVPVTRQQSNPRRGSSRGGNRGHTSSNHQRGGRGRDAPASFPSPNLDHASTSSSHNTPARGGSRGGRGYGNWNRHSSTPVHT